jgi:Fe-S-cluster containining protein
MNSILKLPRALYRRFMQLVDKNYIASKLAKRKGSCKKCGQCCKGCRHLDKDNLCKIYDNRPWACYKEFPLDKLDKEIWQVTKCGYKFTE